MFGSLLGGMGGAGAGLGGGAAAGGPDMMSFFNNPSLMNMVCFVFAKKKTRLIFLLIYRRCNSFKILKFKDCKIFDYHLRLFIFNSRMANLVTNLGAQEGGEVGIETLLQT